MSATGTGRSGPRPVDASMDLLNQILRQPVDPDYAVVAARGGSRPRAHLLLAAAAVLVGAMFAVGALQTTRSAPALQTERASLITRVQAAETAQDELRARAAALAAENATLRVAALGLDDTSQSLEKQIATLGPVVGTTPVTGPGVVVIVDDAPSAASDNRDRVLDLDLQVLANGLWRAGAEAVAINGHRLTTVTAIRSAGDAITVDYRSLNPPYRVEAIGDPRSLPARFSESAAGAWWTDLSRNREMPFSLDTAKKLALEADPGITLRYAKRATS